MTDNENSSFKECNVVMVSTENKTRLYSYKGDLAFSNDYEKVEDEDFTNQHLYITSDDEIKEGDWCFYESKNLEDILDNDMVFQAGKESRCIQYNKETINCSFNTWLYKEECKKIIATTDKLKIGEDIQEDLTPEGQVWDTRSYPIYLPQPSQSFIKEYCELGGIDKVLVEYKKGRCTHNSCYTPECKNLCYIIKTDSHNTITIKEVKEKMYSESKVIDLLHLAMATASAYGMKMSQANADSWIKENL